MFRRAPRKSHFYRYVPAFLVGLLALQRPTFVAADEMLVAIGTYTKDANAGLCVSSFNPETGELRPATVAAATPNPSFLAWHPTKPYLYVVNENGTIAGQNGGGLSSFRVERETGKLTPVNAVSYRGGVCHLSVDATGNYVLAATYGGGNAASFNLQDDGQIGEQKSLVQHQGSSVNTRRQEGPHAHQVVLSSDNRFAFVVDLGTDKIMVYRFDAATGVLTPNDPAFATVTAGSGPRHLAFHPSAKYLYVVNELSNSVTTFRYDAATGACTELQNIATLPASYEEKSTTAEIAVHPNGRFLYVSNRGHDSIATFAIEPESGLLSAVGYTKTEGRNPRHFTLDPTGRWLLAANQNSQSVTVFSVNEQTGTLAKSSQLTAIPGDPVCVSFMPQ